MKKRKLKKEDILSERVGIQCLIFDFDGTLAETEEAHRNAFNKAFNSNKMNWYWDQHIYKKLPNGLWPSDHLPILVTY